MEVAEEQTVGELVDLEMVKRSWPVVLEEIRKESKKLHALLGDSGVHSFEGNVLTIEVRFPIHAEMLQEAKNSRVIAHAAEIVFGINPQVRAVVGGVTEAPEVASDAASSDPVDVLRSGFGDDLVEE